MDYADENCPQSINECYKIWKHNSPFLYQTLQVYQLPSCSQTVEWYPQHYISQCWQVNKLLLGTNSITKNYIYLADVALPTDDTLVDYTQYKQKQINGVATIGGKALKIYRSFPQNGEILKLRVQAQGENKEKGTGKGKGRLVGAWVGGTDYQCFVFDPNLGVEIVQESKIGLSGHDCEGFGFDWNGLKENYIVTGAYDKRACIWDIGQKQSNIIKPIKILEHTSGVEDTKWFKKDANLVATATQDKHVSIWDIRDNGKKPAITRSAHNGQVYSVDLNHFSQYLLLSGGEDSDINLWDTRHMTRMLHKFIGHGDSITKVEWSTKNPYSFSSSSFDRRVVTWNMKKLSEQKQSEPNRQNQIEFIHAGHRSNVLDFSWNQRQTVCASTEENNILHVWEMNQKIREL